MCHTTHYRGIVLAHTGGHAAVRSNPRSAAGQRARIVLTPRRKGRSFSNLFSFRERIQIAVYAAIGVLALLCGMYIGVYLYHAEEAAEATPATQSVHAR